MCDVYKFIHLELYLPSRNVCMSKTQSASSLVKVEKGQCSGQSDGWKEEVQHRWWTSRDQKEKTERKKKKKSGIRATPIGKIKSMSSHYLLNFSMDLNLPAWLHPHSMGAVLSQMQLNLSYWRQGQRPGTFGQHAEERALLTSIWKIGEKWH